MSDDLGLALRLADLADSITLPLFRAEGLCVETKADATPVTEADLRTEEALRQALLRERPGQAVAGEELGSQGDSEWRWILDPIDGTRNYARGVPVWATLIALRRLDEPVCAVVSAPALGRRWWASRGAGAFAAGPRRLHVSSVARLAEAYLSTTEARDLDARGYGDGYRAIERSCRQVRAFGDFWSHMLVAEGVIDIGLEPVAAPWDIAAPQLIVEEAGGRFSDLTGMRRIDGGDALTSNGLLHDEVLARLRARAPGGPIPGRG